MSTLALGLQDLKRSLARFDIAILLAQEEINGKYRRTVLGPFWIAVANLIYIGGLTLVFSSVMKMEVRDYVVYLAVGMAIWTLISTVLIEAPMTFIFSKGFIESYTLPWGVQIFRRLLSNLYVFAIQAVIAIGILFVTGHHLEPIALMAAPGLLIVVTACVGAALCLSVLGARYRDVSPTVASAVTFLFILTPIFWQSSSLGGHRPAVTHFNPFFHLVEIVRAPVLGHNASLDSWIFSAVIAIALLVTGLSTYGYGRRHLLHWV